MKMAGLVIMNMALAAMFLQLAIATDHTVGSPSGSWDLSTALQTWASSNKFIVGDSLTFQYPVGMHSVFEVSKTDYESCTTSNPIMTDSSGNTFVPLKAEGKRYFICGVPGHCDFGMKIEVDINPSNPPPSPKSFPSPSPPHHSTPFKAPPFNPSPFTSTPIKPPPFASIPLFKPPPSFKPPHSKFSPSPSSKVSAPSKSPPSSAMTPMTSPKKGPASPIGSPSLATASASAKRDNFQPIQGIAIAMALIAIYGF